MLYLKKKKTFGQINYFDPPLPSHVAYFMMILQEFKKLDSVGNVQGSH